MFRGQPFQRKVSPCPCRRWQGTYRPDRDLQALLERRPARALPGAARVRRQQPERSSLSKGRGVRVGMEHSWRTSLGDGGAFDRAHNGGVRAATAKIWPHVTADFIVCRIWLCAQQCLRAHHHSGNAITALRGFLVDKRLLELVWFTIFEQPFERRDLAVTHRGDWPDARERWAPINMNGASTPFPQAAAKSRTMQSDIVTQNIK